MVAIYIPYGWEIILKSPAIWNFQQNEESGQKKRSPTIFVSTDLESTRMSKTHNL